MCQTETVVIEDGNNRGRTVDPKTMNAALQNPQDCREPKSEIVEFFKGRNVFITGGTGFLGCVLIYKLLMFCPDIGKIYLLIREKRGVKHEQRLKDMRSHKLLVDVEKQIPGQVGKLRVVQGDIMEKGLAISKEDRDELVKEVSVVFHSAATVRFDEVLSKAVSMNVRGTKEMLDLAKDIKQLVSFIHVSTCFCHCNRENEIIKEIIYPPEKESVAQVLSMCEGNKDVDSVQRTREVIGKRPNTYTYTKAIAEQLIGLERDDLPIAIIRPSIVVAGMRGPLKGWVDNMNGATGIVVGSGHGVLRSLYGNPDLTADMIPVDIVINLMMAASWKTYVQYKQGGVKDVPVYNCNSGSEKALTWNQLYTMGIKVSSENPFENVMLPPAGAFHSRKIYDRIYRTFAHWLPAYIMDFLLWASGKKPVVVKLIGKMHRGISALEYFINREWTWSNDNLVALDGDLNQTDRTLFNFCLHDLDWEDFVRHYYLGVRHNVLMYKPETIDTCRQKVRNMYLVYDFLRSIITAGVVYYFFSRIMTIF